MRKRYCGIKIEQILKVTKTKLNKQTPKTHFLYQIHQKYRLVLDTIHLFINITAKILTNSSIFSSKDLLYVAGMYMIPVKGQKLFICSLSHIKIKCRSFPPIDHKIHVINHYCLLASNHYSLFLESIELQFPMLSTAISKAIWIYTG